MNKPGNRWRILTAAFEKPELHKSKSHVMKVRIHFGDKISFIAACERLRESLKEDAPFTIETGMLRDKR